jgi:hypothetical protein
MNKPQRDATTIPKNAGHNEKETAMSSTPRLVKSLQEDEHHDMAPDPRDDLVAPVVAPMSTNQSDRIRKDEEAREDQHGAAKSVDHKRSPSIDAEPIGKGDKHDNDADPGDGLSRHDILLAPPRRREEREQKIKTEGDQSEGEKGVAAHGHSPVHAMLAGLAAAVAGARAARASSLKRRP